MLVDGVNVELRPAGRVVAARRRGWSDVENPENNDWLAVNQFTVAEGQHTRAPMW